MYIKEKSNLPVHPYGIILRDVRKVRVVRVVRMVRIVRR